MSGSSRVQEDTSYERRLASLERQFRSARLPTAGAGAGWSYDGAGAPRLPGGVIAPSGGFVVPPGSAPPDPTGLTLTAGAGDGDVWLDIGWTPAAVTVAGPIVAWLIEVLADGDTLPLVFHPTVSQAPPFRASGLTADTLYHVTVHALTQLGASSSGLTGSQSTSHDAGPPATLTGLAGAAYYTGVVVAWTHLGTVQVPFQGHYEAQLATNVGFTTGVQTKDTGLSSVASFAGLTTGQQVWVRVRAVSSAGVAGAWSSAITMTPGTVAPGDLAAGTLASGVVYAGVVDAGQITTGTLDAAVATIIHLNASNISAGQMDVGRLGAGTIGAYLIQLASGGIIRSANYVPGVSGWNMDGAGNLEANNAVFRGVLAAASIASDDLTIYGVSGRKSVRLFTESISGTPKSWLMLGDGSLTGLGLNWFNDRYTMVVTDPGGAAGGFVVGPGPLQTVGILYADGSLTAGGSGWSGGLYGRDLGGALDSNVGFEFHNAGSNNLYTAAKMVLDGTGDHRIGWLDTSAGGIGWCAYVDTSGNLHARTAWAIFSSETIKKQIRALPGGGHARAKLAQSKPSTYLLKTDKRRKLPRVGFIAEHELTAFPELVTANDAPDLPPYSIDLMGYVPYLVQDANDTAARLDAIEAKLAALRG